MSELDKILGGLLGGGSSGSQSLSGGSGGGGANIIGALLPVVGGMLAGGGLQKLLSGFQAKGLGSQADSWVGTGANEPISGGQVREVIGDDKVAEIAQQAGISKEEAEDGLADLLPQVVDKASPDGQLPPESELDSAFTQLQRSAGAA